MPDQPTTTLREHLRQSAKQGYDLRNRLLELAEDLPPPERERLRQTAAKILTFCTQLREIAMGLPADPAVDLFDALDDPEEVRDRIEGALENYFESALDDLQEIVEDMEAEGEEGEEPAE
jgi:hypothetical protein